MQLGSFTFKSLLDEPRFSQSGSVKEMRACRVHWEWNISGVTLGAEVPAVLLLRFRVASGIRDGHGCFGFYSVNVYCWRKCKLLSSRVRLNVRHKTLYNSRAFSWSEERTPFFYFGLQCKLLFQRRQTFKVVLINSSSRFLKVFQSSKAHFLCSSRPFSEDSFSLI